MGYALNLSQMFANVVIILGGIIALLQLNSAIKQLHLEQEIAKADLERRKKEATIMFTHEIIQKLDRLNVHILEIFKHDTVNVEDPRYKNNERIQQDIKRYLNMMERVSVGINSKVYDFEIFNRICGGRTLRSWNRLFNVVKEYRSKNIEYISYQEFEVLVDQIKKSRNGRISHKGDIDNMIEKMG